MPRKIRQLKADLRSAGFLELPGRGKGSHAMWQYPGVPDVAVILAGKDGDDAKSYQERDVLRAIREALGKRERS
ncbi:MAG: type II toxin-antitoxin system HicA family toxin [Chloroflexota bacterium]|nr:type II toxin-antitoxin system HicA family toxin [Chloroflexota bacterium]